MKKGTFLIAAGALCILAAICLILYNVITDQSAGSASEEALSQVISHVEESIPAEGKMTADLPRDAEGHEDDVLYPDYVVNPRMEMPVNTTDGIGYVGILDLPTLNKSLPVASEWTYKTLRVTPCRFAGTPYRQNMVICAHNYSRHFGDITDLKYGDEVSFTDMAGNVFTYEVAEIETLSPDDFAYMTEGKYPLTLFTCTLGGASRITVRCQEKQQKDFK